MDFYFGNRIKNEILFLFNGISEMMYHYKCYGEIFGDFLELLIGIHRKI